MDKITEIKKFYDDATIRKLHGFIFTNRRVEYAFQSLNYIFEFNKPIHVLEIGSGIGEISFRLASKFTDSKFIGFDISDQSVHISRVLFPLPNLSFISADSVTEMKLSTDHKFDVIFLMDVYEHISVQQRGELHQFIKQNISANGYVFISCPTIHHQNYLRQNNPTDIQPIDEDITLKELIGFADETLLNLISYKEVSVWRTSDYSHTIFSNRKAGQTFSDFKSEIDQHSIGLRKVIFNKIKRLINSKTQATVDSTIQKKKDILRKNLGQDFLTKVEAFKK